MVERVGSNDRSIYWPRRTSTSPQSILWDYPAIIKSYCHFGGYRSREGHKVERPLGTPNFLHRWHRVPVRCNSTSLEATEVLSRY